MLKLRSGNGECKWIEIGSDQEIVMDVGSGLVGLVVIFSSAYALFGAFLM
ncbi:hypothetical protein ACFL3M_03300 [Patescibacteria group bacterium]